MNAFTHQLADCLRLIGMRDRLRCPHCSAVGTWKPHGGWLDFEDERKVRRWMCKWCGHYVGPEGVKRVVIGATAWVMVEDAPNGPTPWEIMFDKLGERGILAPWRG